MECANLDAALRWYAALCCEFCEQARHWGHAIFSGQAAFDPEVEQVWLDAGRRLYDRAREVWSYGQKQAEGPCYVLEGGAVLGSALWYLGQLLGSWVTPKLAVGPMSRQGIAVTPGAAEEVRRRIAALPPL